jgi:hypothetical protein
MKHDCYGAWLYVEFSDVPVNAPGGDTMEASGEFITYDNNTVYLLTTGSLIQINVKEISYAYLQLYNKEFNSYIPWFLIGIATTISHGYWAILSAPSWLIAGTYATAVEAESDIYRVERPDEAFWYNYRRFSRFPQGLPKGLDLKKLKAKGAYVIDTQ